MMWTPRQSSVAVLESGLFSDLTTAKHHGCRRGASLVKMALKRWSKRSMH